MSYILKKRIAAILALCLFASTLVQPVHASEPRWLAEWMDFDEADVVVSETFAEEADLDESDETEAPEASDDEEAEQPEQTDADEVDEEEPEEPRLPAVAVYNPVPLYWQTDYPNVPYGKGTVATDGCSMTCMAMIVSYLREMTVKPDKLAKEFGASDGSQIQRCEAVSICYDLKYTKTFSIDDTVAALCQGKVVLIMVNKESAFTDNQHFLVLKGILPDGRILVNDSNGYNYNRWDLRDGFENGFTQDVVFYGFSGAWIFEPYTPPVVGPSQYPGILLTREETDALAKLIWLEARGESLEGQQAIAEIVLNRLVSPRFTQKKIIDIIYAEDQFSSAKFLPDVTGDPLQYKAIERALDGPNVLPLDVFYYSRNIYRANLWGIIGRHAFW